MNNLRNRIRHLLGALPAAAGQAGDYERWQRSHDDRVIRALTRLLTRIPESRREQVFGLVRLARYKHGPFPGRGFEELEIDNPGLQDLLRKVLGDSYSGGPWADPPELPEALVDAYLDEPRATPRLRCAACNLWLPFAQGYWARDFEPTKWWQGPLVPLTDCPGCGATVWSGGGGYFMPTSPTPGWTFKSDDEKLAEDDVMGRKRT